MGKNVKENCKTVVSLTLDDGTIGAIARYQSLMLDCYGLRVSRSEAASGLITVGISHILASFNEENYGQLPYMLDSMNACAPVNGTVE